VGDPTAACHHRRSSSRSSKRVSQLEFLCSAIDYEHARWARRG
jgi:hypothetical protein